MTRYYGQSIALFKKQKQYFYTRNKFLGFKKITNERKSKIDAQVKLWLSTNYFSSPKDTLYQIFNLLNHENSFGIQPNDESFLFLILAFDPTLKILQIYMEESKMQEISKRFLEEFGFAYDSNLLILEKYFNEKFPTIIDEFNHEYSK